VEPGETEKSEFIRLTGASRGTVAMLERYAGLLGEWNRKFNLVAPSTLEHVWSRHFLDSAQLLPLLPPGGGILADLGSGAGFPGLVLSVMGVADIHLIESTGKKAQFLRAVVDGLGLKAVTHQCRVEEMVEFRADIVTARAVAPLNELLSLAARLVKREGLCLFLKGQNAEAELTEAKKYWMFDCVKTQSLSDESGKILAVRNLHFNVQRKPKISRRK
jgi:16S rRNA (guanine527-N7)-methyltransferase